MKPLENDGKHIHDIMGRTECESHAAARGVACWDIRPANTNGVLYALCNRRVRRSGYIGVPSAPVGSNPVRPNRTRS